MKAHLFTIECLTNLHVGNGDANYNIIDNEVERDYVLNTPIIPSSGIKGALREHFEAKWGKKDLRITEIFGSDFGQTSLGKTEPGTYKFFGAQLLVRPMRVSEGTVSFVQVTSLENINAFLNLLSGVGIEKLLGVQTAAKFSLDVQKNVIYTNNPDKSRAVEGIKTIEFPPEAKALEEFLDKLVGGDYAIVDKLSRYDLPVLARNQLDNGISKNLWYEEIVPHKSLFAFVVLTPDENIELEFEINTAVQFGGNASIGCGYTRVTEVSCN